MLASRGALGLSLAVNLALLLALIAPATLESLFFGLGDDLRCIGGVDSSDVVDEQTVQVAEMIAQDESTLSPSLTVAAGSTSSPSSTVIPEMLPLPPFPKIAERRMFVNKTVGLTLKGLGLSPRVNYTFEFSSLPVCVKNCTQNEACRACSFNSSANQCVDYKPENSVLVVEGSSTVSLVLRAEQEIAMFSHVQAPALLSERRLLIVNWLSRATSMDMLRFITAHGLQLPADVDVVFACLTNLHTWCLVSPSGLDLAYISFVVMAKSLPGYRGYLLTTSDTTVLWRRLPEETRKSWSAFTLQSSALDTEPLIIGPQSGASSAFPDSLQARLERASKTIGSSLTGPLAIAKEDSESSFYVAAQDVEKALVVLPILAEHGVHHRGAVPLLFSLLKTEPYKVQTGLFDATQSQPKPALVRPTPITDVKVREWLLTVLGGNGWPLPLPGGGPW